MTYYYRIVSILELLSNSCLFCVVSGFNFRRAHTVTALVLICCVLGYVSFVEETPQDPSYNHQRYIYAYCMVFAHICMIY